MHRWIIVLAAIGLPSMALAVEPQAVRVAFTQNVNSLQINIDGRSVGEYVFSDEQILRPYIRHLRTLGGRQVTRNSPPAAGDLDDHATMHPGLWLAFGDLGGADFWRNKAKVKQIGFSQVPQDGIGSGTFSVRNSYEVDGKSLCTEECLVGVNVVPTGYRLDWTSVFHSEAGDFAFGDQEEMGFGVRVATPLAVVSGGQIMDSQDRKNGKAVWGQRADWCQYGGSIDGRQVGVVLMPCPQNFRRSWFHARDYGLLVANPFGQNAFTKGEKSQIVVRKGERLRLRFGLLVYDVGPESHVSFKSAFNDFVKANRAP